MSDFRQNVLDGKFKEAYEIAKSMKITELCNELIAISFDSKNMLAYGFVEYVLLINESIKYHCIADTLLSTSYVDIDGASELGLLHIRRALEIDENSILALLSLMSCAQDPDTSATREDYYWAKAKIAKLYPGDALLECNYIEQRLTEDIMSRSKAIQLLEE